MAPKLAYLEQELNMARAALRDHVLRIPAIWPTASTSAARASRRAARPASTRPTSSRPPR